MQDSMVHTIDPGLKPVFLLVLVLFISVASAQPPD